MATGPRKRPHDTPRLRAGPPIIIRSSAYREQNLAYRVGPHTMNFHQWYCVIHGTVDMTLNGRDLPLDPWDSVVIPPRAVRGPRCRDEAPGYFYVIFENHRLNLAGIAGRVLTPPAELRSELRQLAGEMRSPSGVHSVELVHALTVRLLIGLTRALSRSSPVPVAPGTPHATAYYREKVAQVEAFMRRNLARPLARQDFAEVAHLSPPHLARVFRAIAGRTLLERLTELRMAAARELLAESSMSATEIALDVGYNSFSHFSTVFRKHVGMRPSEYRATCSPTSAPTDPDSVPLWSPPD